MSYSYPYQQQGQEHPHQHQQAYAPHIPPGPPPLHAADGAHPHPQEPPPAMISAQYPPSAGPSSMEYYSSEAYGARYDAGPSIHFIPPTAHGLPPPPLPRALPSGPPQRERPPLSLNLPPASFNDPNAFAHHPHPYTSQPQSDLVSFPSTSPYYTPHGMPTMTPGSANSSNGMNEYFPPIDPATMSSQNTSIIPTSYPSPKWSSALPSNAVARSDHKASSSRGGKSGKYGGTHGAKTSRQQFTACGACRHRRVKCDLKDRQEAAEKLAGLDGNTEGANQSGSALARRKKVTCTNCRERGTNCIDEYAPLKAAKQLRRGKRISEIEMLYGKSAANAAMAVKTEDELSEGSKSPGKAKEVDEVFTGIPELSSDFFASPFFRRFQIQRPVLDPVEFVDRYLSSNPPTAAAMGPEGAVLVHVLYAWAVSYGVNEHGQLDVPDGGGVPTGLPVDLIKPDETEIKREADRQRRKTKMKHVIEVILQKIDELGIMRKPTWDGVRVLLIVLPLTEGIASPVERLAMYDAAISQVFTLCSHIGLGYDGHPSKSSGANGGTDSSGTVDVHMIRVRIYWYAFVHEGITTGLKGGRLHLDDEDLETMQEAVENRAVVTTSSQFGRVAKLATAPINLALACRLINKALTGPSAKRRQFVNPDLVKNAWEALERCWEEFESLRYSSPSHAYASSDDVLRFADGWKIFLFEAQNVIRKCLEDRLSKLVDDQGKTGAYILDQDTDRTAAIVNLQHLIEIAKDKCEIKTKQVLAIVRQQVGTRFFEWDASLVRDGTYYAAMMNVQSGGGSDEEVALCIQALNELRWAHAKSWDRTADVRREWAHSRIISGQTGIEGWDPTSEDETYAFHISSTTELDALSANVHAINSHEPSPDGSPYDLTNVYNAVGGVSVGSAPGSSSNSTISSHYRQQQSQQHPQTQPAPAQLSMQQIHSIGPPGLMMGPTSQGGGSGVGGQQWYGNQTTSFDPHQQNPHNNHAHQPPYPQYPPGQSHPPGMMVNTSLQLENTQSHDHNPVNGVHYEAGPRSLSQPVHHVQNVESQTVDHHHHAPLPQHPPHAQSQYHPPHQYQGQQPTNGHYMRFYDGERGHTYRIAACR